jgi:dienelactone hydrolase
MAVNVSRVRSRGLAGVMCTPAGAGPAPGVLLLGGSEGGFHERDARLLAQEGFTVLALAYFGAPGLPAGLVEVPLEYFSRALDQLAAQPRAGDRFAVVGGSRGGEAALLIGAHDARVAGEVSVSGSGVVTAGIDYTRGGLLDILTAPATSWTLHGRPLPQLPYVIPPELRRGIGEGLPVRLADAYPVPVADPALLEQVSIPVERIRGPVLLIEGQDDQMWPAAELSAVAEDRLRAHGHEFGFRHHVFPDAGHAVMGPPGQTVIGTVIPGPGVQFDGGGSPAATSAARDKAWRLTIDFLADCGT